MKGIANVLNNLPLDFMPLDTTMQKKMMENLKDIQE